MLGFVPHRARDKAFVIAGQVVLHLLEVRRCSRSSSSEVLIDRYLRCRINRFDERVLIDPRPDDLIGRVQPYGAWDAGNRSGGGCPRSCRGQVVGVKDFLLCKLAPVSFTQQFIAASVHEREDLHNVLVGITGDRGGSRYPEFVRYLLHQLEHRARHS